MKSTYYYTRLQNLLKFLIPENKSILCYGSFSDGFLSSLNASEAILVSEEFKDKSSYRGRAEFVHCKYHLYKPSGKFDYIVLDTAIGKTENINLLFKNISGACLEHTRIIIHQENYLWRPILDIATSFGLKKFEKTHNWLSIKDTETYLKAAGFESTRTYKKTLIPLKMAYLGELINKFFSIIPFLDFLKLDQFIVVRYRFSQYHDSSDSDLTICLTTENEEQIESIVASIPVLCENQEIIFLPLNSSENKIKEIERIKMLFPHKNLRIINQIMKSKSETIRNGFSEAKGKIIILFEAERATDPYDIQYFFESIKKRQFEFIEGSRFVYPLSFYSMPFLNKLADMLFAKWFSFFMNQRTTDVLSGIKAIRKKDFENINNSWGFLGISDPYGDFELLFGSARYGLKIGEIPIHYKPTKKKTKKLITHGWYLLLLSMAGYFIFRNSIVQKK